MGGCELYYDMNLLRCDLTLACIIFWVLIAEVFTGFLLNPQLNEVGEVAR